MKSVLKFFENKKSPKLIKCFSEYLYMKFVLERVFHDTWNMFRKKLVKTRCCFVFLDLLSSSSTSFSFSSFSTTLVRLVKDIWIFLQVLWEYNSVTRIKYDSIKGEKRLHLVTTCQTKMKAWECAEGHMRGEEILNWGISFRDSQSMVWILSLQSLFL